MAEATANWDVLEMAEGPGELWANVPVPGAASRIVIGANGRPETPAIHLGHTRGGAQLLVEPAYEDRFVDEVPTSVDKKMSGLRMAISAELTQLLNLDVLEQLTLGYGSKVTATGIKQVTFGLGTPDYTSVALVFRTKADPTKFGIFQLYQAINTAGLGTINITAKDYAGSSVTFEGMAITSRAAGDQVGTIWWQE